MRRAILIYLAVPITAVLFSFWPCSVVLAQTFPTTGPGEKVICLICIGDSITAGSSLPDPAKQCAPVVLARELAAGSSPGTTVYLTNVGKGGTTTEDWIPPKGLVTRADKSAAKLMADHPTGELIFSIMLGTNDSANHGPRGSPISPDHYRQNLKLITDTLAGKYPACQIFIHHAIFYSKNTHNAADYEGDSAHDRLQSYFPEIDSLIADDAKSEHRHLYPGDVDAYDHFAKAWETEFLPQAGKNGTFYLHPNPRGAESLGKYWAAAILKNLK